MYMSKWMSPLFLIIYIIASVFHTVGGQSTAGVDDRYDDKLGNTVAMLQAKLAKLAARNEKLEADHAALTKTVDRIVENATLSNG